MQPNGELHIAIVPDGNRRWAKKKNKPEWYGHIAGAKKLEQVTDWCSKHPEIKTLSVYALSTENLNRDKVELNKLWEIYKKEFKKILNSKEIKKNQIRINVIGNSLVWRSDVRHAAKAVMTATKNYTRGVMNILLAYGSKFEILHAVKKILKKGIKTFPSVEDAFHRFLLVNKPVDLVIRTGGQQRLSNFLLYQSSYAEIYFSKTLWPDFSKKEFEKILDRYRISVKNFGH